ncbi:DUF2207 domain-containing protein [Clostridium peptidivorans]|uniref:DUF2207 domain-containing protein n=1 Tax=Clostridium peptidivorans TaxID=100174 RepID=UPI000BE36CFE|nr:DUF2207 domain-containing protein [Clostridium peptidivorans]
MKNLRKYQLSLCMFIMIITLIFGKSTVKAEEKIIISNWNVNSSVMEDGSININEYITFKFNDKFNGVYRSIVLTGTEGISNLRIYEKTPYKDIEYKKVDKASKGDKNVYTVDIKKDTAEIKIFSPSKSKEQKTFNLVYMMSKVSTRYNDTAELYYNFLGNENETPIENFNVNIGFLYNFDKDKVKIFAHGPLNGTVKFVNNNTVNLNVKNVPKKTSISGRILFPREFLDKKLYPKTKNEKGYNKILQEELKSAENIKKKLERKNTLKNTFNNISLILSIAILAALFYIFNKLKRNKIDLSRDYNISPKISTPAMLSILYYNTLDFKSILATLLDLNKKGYIEVNEIGEVDEKTKDYLMQRIKENTEELEKHEVFFMNWIFGEISANNCITTKKLKEYAESHKNEFAEQFKKWENIVKDKFDENNYIDKGGKKYGTPVMVTSFIFLGVSIAALVNEAMAGVLLMIISIISLITGLTLFYRKSDLGYEEYTKWQHLFKRVKKKDEAGDIYLFENYLPYFIVMGLNHRHVENFKIKTQKTSYSTGFFAWYYLANSTSGNNFNSSLNSALQSTVPGSGAGGGFSSGSGGASGGGGAGGF